MGQYLPISVELLLAFLVGGAIGMQRELKGKPAGLKTNALICMGACLYTVVSRQIFGLRDAHIVAQIVTGIGFIGGGAILREGLTVVGLTTAATIWVVGALGAFIGYQQYWTAIEASLAVLAVLILLSPVDAWITRMAARGCHEQVLLPDDRGLEQLAQLLVKMRVIATEFQIERLAEGARVTFNHNGTPGELARLHHAISGLAGCRVEQRAEREAA